MVLDQEKHNTARAAAQEYVGAIHALDLLVKANALAVCSENIPDEEHLQAHLDKFRSSKPTPTRAKVLEAKSPTFGTKQCANNSRMHLSRQERMPFVNTA